MFTRRLTLIGLLAACAAPAACSSSSDPGSQHDAGTRDSGEQHDGAPVGSDAPPAGPDAPRMGHTITKLTIDGVDGAIDDDGDVIVSLPLPLGADLSNLTPTIEIAGTSISPASGVAQDFTHPVSYTVTGTDGFQYGYTVRVSAGFAAKVDFATGQNPGPIAVGDFNHDGKPDLAIGNNTGATSTVSILLNTTTGATPTFSPKVDFAISGNPAAILVADYDDDGRPDLAVSTDGGGSILINATASGATTPSFTATVAGLNPAAGFDPSPTSAATADFNGDGLPDVVLPDHQTPGHAVVSLDNTGSVTADFHPFEDSYAFAARPGGNNDAVADVDGDGRPDIVVANYNDSTLSVLINTTPSLSTIPSFATAVTVTAGSGIGGAYRIATGDINQDGKPDVVVSNANGIAVVLNTTTHAGSPTFAAPVLFATANAFVVIADLDRDGKPDVVTSGGYDWVGVLRNTTAANATTATFAPEVDFGTNVLPQSIAIADFNGDGKPDLAAPASSSTGTTNRVSVLAGE